eukprot:7871904-Prorocentrum_lima.AAC.1
MTSSLVGSEMCIRDSYMVGPNFDAVVVIDLTSPQHVQELWRYIRARKPAVSYTHLTLPTICSV